MPSTRQLAASMFACRSLCAGGFTGITGLKFFYNHKNNLFLFMFTLLLSYFPH